MRTAYIYVSPEIARDCRTAADLMGLDCADAAADALLRKQLDAIPELQEMRRSIGKAVGKVREEWQAKYAPPPSER